MRRWAFGDVLEVVQLVFLQWLFARPAVYCSVGSRTWDLVFFGLFGVFVWGIMGENRVTCAFMKKFISLEGIELNWTRIVSANFSRDKFMRLYWRMRSPFLINCAFAQLRSEVVSSWSWSLICFMLTSINKVGFLTDIFNLLFLLWPAFFHVISIGRREVEFLLSLGNLVKIGNFFCSFWLE